MWFSFAQKPLGFGCRVIFGIRTITALGLNLASGVNESFGNENCLWVNGGLYPLSDVLFQHQDEGHWTIRSLDEKLNLDKDGMATL